MKSLKNSLAYFLIASVALAAAFQVYQGRAEAHVSIASSPTTSCGSMDSADFNTHVSNQIDSRLAGQSTTTAWSMYSTTGGAETLYGATTTPWIRNAGVWTSSTGTPVDFTGVSAWNQMYNGYSAPNQHIATLISPRHFVTAHHWGITDGATLAFIANDNSIVYRTVVSSMQVGGTDVQVGMLDSDVPDTITYYPIISSSTLASVMKKYSGDSLDVPVIVLSSVSNQVLIRSLNGIADGSAGSGILNSVYNSGLRAPFSGDQSNGDSGNPGFIIVDGQPTLLWTTYNYRAGPQQGAYIDGINAAMTSLGGGYQVTQYDPSCFTTYVPNFLPTIQKSYPISIPIVFNPVISTSTPVVTFSGTDRDAGQTLAFSIDSITANGTSSPIAISDLFTIGTTSSSITLYQKVGINPSLYGSTLTVTARVTDSAVGARLQDRRLLTSFFTKTLLFPD